MPIPVNNAELVRLYESGMTLRAIADRYGVKKQAVHGRLKCIGYKPRPSHIQRRTFDRETLVDLYVTKDLSLEKVAEHLKADRGSVRNELIRHGIECRRRGGRSKYRPYFAKLSSVGDSVLIPWKYPRYAHKTLHVAAERFGIKVSIKKAGDFQMRVTRKA